MSFKFEHKGKNYWAKQTKAITEVFQLGVKGSAEQVLVVNGKPDVSEVISYLDALPILEKTS
jgi:hypothetical protein